MTHAQFEETIRWRIFVVILVVGAVIVGGTQLLRPMEPSVDEFGDRWEVRWGSSFNPFEYKKYKDEGAVVEYLILPDDKQIRAMFVAREHDILKIERQEIANGKFIEYETPIDDSVLLREVERRLFEGQAILDEHRDSTTTADEQSLISGIFLLKF